MHNSAQAAVRSILLRAQPCLAAFVLTAAALGTAAPARACSKELCSPPVRLFARDAEVPGNLVYFELLGGLNVDGQLQPASPLTLETAEGEPIAASVQTVGSDRVFAPDQPIAAGTHVVLKYRPSCLSADDGPAEIEYAFTTGAAFTAVLPAEPSLEITEQGQGGERSRALVKLHYAQDASGGAEALAHLIALTVAVDGERAPLDPDGLSASVQTRCAQRDEEIHDGCGVLTYVSEGEHSVAAKGKIIGFGDLPELRAGVETRCSAERDDEAADAEPVDAVEPSNGGCSLAATPQSGPSSLLALLGLFMIRARARRRRLATRLGLVGVVLGTSFGSVGCEAAGGGAEESEGAERSPIFAGSIHVSNQEELARLEGVEVITGDLRLSGVESLAALSSLVHVQGSVLLDSNAALQSLAGLEKLMRVNGDFAIVGAPRLRSLEGLDALEQVGGGVALSSLAIRDLTGLGALDFVRGDLAISFNSKLESLSGLETLMGVGGSLELLSNEALVSARLSERGEGPSIAGHVRVLGNARLRELDGFGYLAPREGACKVGEEDVWIADNEQLETITLPSTFKRRACVTIFDNPVLVTLAGGDIGALDTLTLLQLPILTTVDLHFSEIGTLDITKTGLPGLEGLAPVRCRLSLSSNPALKSLGGFATSPGQVADSVVVRDNGQLSQCAVDGMLSALREPTLRCVDPVTSSARLSRVTDAQNNDAAAVCEAAAR